MADPTNAEKYDWLLGFLVNDAGFPADWYVHGVFYPIWFIEDLAQKQWERDARPTDVTVADYEELVSTELGLSS